MLTLVETGWRYTRSFLPVLHNFCRSKIISKLNFKKKITSSNKHTLGEDSQFYAIPKECNNTFKVLKLPTI